MRFSLRAILLIAFFTGVGSMGFYSPLLAQDATLTITDGPEVIVNIPLIGEVAVNPQNGDLEAEQFDTSWYVDVPGYGTSPDGTLTLLPETANIGEAGSLAFQVTLSRSPDAPVDLVFALNADVASFSASSLVTQTNRTINPGSQNATVTVYGVDDADTVDGGVVLSVAAASSDGGFDGDAAESDIIVIDDDGDPPAECDDVTPPFGKFPDPVQNTFAWPGNNGSFETFFVSSNTYLSLRFVPGSTPDIGTIEWTPGSSGMQTQYLIVLSPCAGDFDESNFAECAGHGSFGDFGWTIGGQQCAMNAGQEYFLNVTATSDPEFPELQTCQSSCSLNIDNSH